MNKKNELIKGKQESTQPNVFNDNLETKTHHFIEEKHHEHILSFLENLFTVLDVGRNYATIINPNLDYVVKFTPELLKKMEEHDIQFLKDKVTGDLLPDLYDYTEKGIGGKIRLEIKGQPTTQDISNLNISIKNLIEQRRIESLMEEIHHLHAIAKRIERGLDNDRFAQVNAGRKHFIDALNYHGTEEEKRKFILDALAMLRQGRESIEATLVEKLNNIEKVPENKIKLIWTCFRHPEYFDEQTKSYNDIQEYFEYYLLSMQPMVLAYSILGQPQSINELLEDSKKVLKHKNIENLCTVEYLLPNKNFQNAWYKNSRMFQNKLLKSYTMNKDDSNLLIKVKGHEVLEVLNHVTKK